MARHFLPTEALRVIGEGLGTVVGTAFAAVVLEALAIRDESSASTTVESHLLRPLRLRQFDARAAVPVSDLRPADVAAAVLKVEQTHGDLPYVDLTEVAEIALMI